jgi:F0F1-type ATP synthase assembly protein I
VAAKDPRLKDYERPQMPFERDAEASGQATNLATVGFEFGGVVALFFLGGLFLDGKLGTEPWLAAAGALLGVAVGMVLLIRRVMRASRSDSGPDRKGQPPR